MPGRKGKWENEMDNNHDKFSIANIFNYSIHSFITENLLFIVEKPYIYLRGPDQRKTSHPQMSFSNIVYWIVSNCRALQEHGKS